MWGFRDFWLRISEFQIRVQAPNLQNRKHRGFRGSGRTTLGFSELGFWAFRLLGGAVRLGDWALKLSVLEGEFWGFLVFSG